MRVPLKVRWSGFDFGGAYVQDTGKLAIQSRNAVPHTLACDAVLQALGAWVVPGVEVDSFELRKMSAFGTKRKSAASA
jgi:hypothetical protein